MDIVPFPIKPAKKTGRPRGASSWSSRVKRLNLEAEIAQVEYDLSVTRRMAIKAGLARDYRTNAKYTAKCQELNDKLFKLQCSINPSPMEMKELKVGI